MFKDFADNAISKIKNIKITGTTRLILIGIVAIVITFFLNKFLEIQARHALLGDNKTVSAKSSGGETELREKMMEAQQEMGDKFYSQASDNAQMPPDSSSGIIGNQPNQQNPMSPMNNSMTKRKATEKYVSLKVINYGKSNPFEPYIDTAISSSNPMYDLPAPPTAVVDNPGAENLLKTTISGIMYDAFSPSAIVSVEGQDHLVRKGDRINGYRILNITKDRVIVQNGTNVYRATVGETLVAQGGNVNFNDVDHLQNKFGGSNKRNSNMIYINSLN